MAPKQIIRIAPSGPPKEPFDFFAWATPATAEKGISRVDADGVSNPDFWAGGDPRGVCIDEETQQIFWTSEAFGGGNPNRIYVSDYDGSGATILVTVTASSEIRGIDCDSNFIYWVQRAGTQAVRRCDKADGANVTTLVDPGTNVLGDIKVDVVNSHLYYTQQNSLRRCNLNGSGDTQIFVGSFSVPALDIDPDAEHIYYSAQNSLRRVDYSGSNDTLILNTSGGSPSHDNVESIMVDLVGEKIYWIDKNDKDIGQCDLDGSNPDKEFGAIPSSQNPQRGDIAYPQGSFYAKPNR